MSITIDQIAKQLSAEIQGNGSLEISGANSLEKAGEGEITFVSNEANVQKLKTCRASAVLASRDLKGSSQLASVSQTIVFVADAKQAFVKVLETFHPPRRRVDLGISQEANVHPSAKIGGKTNIHPGAHIASDVVIGEHCDIHPGVCIGPGCQIGDHTILYPNVVLYHDVRIGQRVIINAGAVIGTDGFGYQFVEGRHEKIPHFGTVRIEDDVEIGANTTIDRALVGETVIGRGSKLDNLVMIAHNCEVGRHNILASQVGVAGSATTGDYVVCAGQVGIADHVHVGTQSIIAAQTGVAKSIKGNQTYFGTPAQPGMDEHKQVMLIRRLPKMRDQLREIAAQIKTMQAQIQSLMGPSSSADGESAAAA